MLLVLGAVASWGGSLMFVGAAQAKTCGQSSAQSTYGGQGQQITQSSCTAAASTLPFTGLDLGLVVAAGAVLVASGLVVRWRLRHGEK